MCGIGGIFSYTKTSSRVNEDELRAISSHMRARGPDGDGQWYSADRRIGLAHRRLSIIDVSDAASQPMKGYNEEIVISFNGEIYNYQEIRMSLEGKGYIFTTQSDTEVLLHLYKDKGDRMLNDLRGMFAFALWDNRKNALLLARDPYGIKPLYYSDNGQTVRFASQVKALLSGGGVSFEKSGAGMVGFYLLGSIPEPHTLYQDIKAVPAGSFMWINQGGPAVPSSFFSLGEIFSEARNQQVSLNVMDFKEIVSDALKETIKYHFIADVPVGAFLSGGIDSNVIVALAKESGFEDLQTLTLGFSEYQGNTQDESVLASYCADYYGCSHTKYTLNSKEFSVDLPRLMDSMDQPSIDGINTYFVSKAASELGWKVALSGVGGDELFGGYSSFKDIISLVKVASFASKIPFMNQIFQNSYSCSSLQNLSLNPKFYGLLEHGGTFPGAYLLKRGLFLPSELPQIMDKDMVVEGLQTLDIFGLIHEQMGSETNSNFAKISAMESNMYMRNQLLRDSDWAGMAHSLEIRTPLVDSHLIKKIAPFLVSKHNSNAKRDFLAKAPKRPLPKMVSHRPKTGFTVPIDKWIQEDKSTDIWRNVASLRKPNCPWARRWAYTLLNQN
jgi:asparagine synthase (glutamine-hydrolysing)